MVKLKSKLILGLPKFIYNIDVSLNKRIYCVYALFMAKPDMERSHGLAMGLRMAYWALHRRTDESLARRGVTANQFVLLALLVEEEGITQQDLVLRASSDPSTIRAMLVLLEKKGLIVRNQHTGDGRALSVAFRAWNSLSSASAFVESASSTRVACKRCSG